ncbi:phosphotransferase family protein [bacterium]|nr:phosphotransferase family protein [bacterium]
MDTQLQSSLTTALAQWPEWCVAKPVLLRQLHGGLTNTSFLIEVNNDLQVLRLNAVNGKALDLNRELERDVFTLASNAGISAALLYCSPRLDYLVYRYVAGHHVQPADVNTELFIPKLAALLTSIHQLPAVSRRLNIRDKAKTYWQQIDASNGMFANLQAITPNIERHIDTAIALNTLPCVCHHDLLAENIIVTETNNLLAIDWEYAAMGDAFFDLAVVVEGLALNTDQTESLLSAYMGTNSPVQLINAQQRLLHSRIVYSYISLLWYGVQYGHKPESFCQNGFDVRLSKLRELLNLA